MYRHTACRISSAHSDCVALEVLAKGPLLALSYTTQMWSSTTAHRFQICSMKLATVEGEEKVKATTEKNWTQPKCNVVILSWIHWISISQCLSSFSGPTWDGDTISPIRKQLELSPGSAQSTQCLGLDVEMKGCRLPSFSSQDRDLRAWEDPSLSVKLPGGTKQKLLPLLLCSAHLSLWGSLIVVFELSANILKTKTDLPWNAKPGFPFLQI